MYTMVLSISHRITGIALSVAFLAFAWWLVALAIGPESYDRAASALGSPFGLLVIAGFVLAYWYHFCAGIRHLVWDTGRMMEKPAASNPVAGAAVQPARPRQHCQLCRVHP